MSALFAFLHHLAAFTLFGALLVELVLLRGTLTAATAGKILRADMLFGISATIVLIVGIARVVFFEKGWDYYSHNAAFILKIGLFIVIGIVSIYPTREFLSWRESVRLGELPSLDPDRLRRVRTIVHLELVGVAIIILCAALMARGYGITA
jgi:putative membrane protein